jgi:hypothetical protein
VLQLLCRLIGGLTSDVRHAAPSRTRVGFKGVGRPDLDLDALDRQRQCFRDNLPQHGVGARPRIGHRGQQGDRPIALDRQLRVGIAGADVPMCHGQATADVRPWF